MLMHQLRITYVAALLGGSLGLLAAPAHSQTTINFDQDANGNTINAPALFSQTTPLTTLYSSLGITFSGPNSNGGSILNDSTFAVKARSGSNFLAFNSLATNAGQQPETFTFSSPESMFSFYAGANSAGSTFTLNAYDGSNNLIGTNVITTSGSSFGQLLISTPGIKKAVLSSSNSVFVVDDLAFSNPNAVTPEGSSLFLLCGGLIPIVGLGQWKRRHRKV